MRALRLLFAASVLVPAGLNGQRPAAAPSSPATEPPGRDARVYAVIDSISAGRIERDIRQLVSFKTRSTLSDTVSQTEGIGAARRWIKAEFDRISAACGGCLEVSYQRSLVKGNPATRIREDTWIVNVVAVQRGTVHPNRYVIMTGDIDNRVSDNFDATSFNPGANDNASGMAGALEAARVLSKYRFGKTIVYAGLSGEEQGLFGGQHMAAVARDSGWVIEGVLNNDMIGNIEGVDGVIDNTTFRVFSEPVPVTETEAERRARRTTGGEVDGPSRQLARYVDRITSQYFTNLSAMMIYRLDRFGRGGHHRPFNDVGFPAVRIMETHENYNRQHQDVRTENGIAYGDVIEGVDFAYARRLTGVNAAVMASVAWAPPPPDSVRISGQVGPSTTLRWRQSPAAELAGYRIYWRLTTEPQWTHSVYVGDVEAFTLRNIVIDNFFFGVAAVSKDGHESVVVFPRSGR